MNPGQSINNNNNNNDDEDLSSHSKDAAILRFNDEFHSVKVTNEGEFMNEFRRRAID
jgi:hypothetical protein